ncbi:MAG TPA: zeta toxin family protein [Polyangia bacterium]|nr:zeta toxin family protein [Polyangia bacterium]
MSRIDVLAGTNGAGKSSIGGAMIRQKGENYFNPDEAARSLMTANPGLTQTQANAEAWQQGKRLLERAIDEGLDFAFETTLGGNTISDLLAKAIAVGIEVRIWYAGLSSPELHIARVTARVARGGHPIPDKDIYRRFERGRENLIKLLPGLTALWIFDNTADADPATGTAPKPVLVLHMEGVKIVGPGDLSATPEWAKPIVAAAMKAAASSSPSAKP